MMGIGVVPMDSEFYLGMIGMHGRTGANLAMQQADLQILCGARVGDRAVSAPQQIAEKAKSSILTSTPLKSAKICRCIFPSSAISAWCSPHWLSRYTQHRARPGWRPCAAISGSIRHAARPHGFR